MQVRVFEVRTEEGFVGMVSIAPRDLGFTKGLRSEAVMGTVPAGTNQILPSNFTVNPVFVRFLHDFIAKHTPTLPEFLGRADRGIIITTGTFTLEAKKEARRDGVPAIELVDGDALVDMFERLEIGLIPKQTYDIDERFFDEYKK